MISQRTDKKTASNCTIEDFAIYFVNYIKTQTAKYIKDTSSNSVPTTPTRETTLHPLAPTPISISRRISTSNQSHTDNVVKEPSVIRRQSTHHSPSIHDSRECTPQKILLRNSSTAALRFTPNEFSTPQRNSTAIERPIVSATPQNESETFSPSHAFKLSDRSLPRKNASTPIYLSDFLLTPTSTPSKKQKSKKNDSSASKNLSTDSDYHKVANTPTSSNVPSPHLAKPKRRVVPITLGNSTNTCAFSSSAFQTENNLIGIGDDAEEPSMSRDLLRTQKAMIVQDFVRHESENDKMLLNRSHTQSHTAGNMSDNFTIDLSKVTSKPTLNRLIGIYAAIINMNLTTNVLSEIAFLLNLLNSDFDRWKNSSDMEIFEVEHIGVLFGNVQNCAFFCIGVLRTQTHVLTMLDLTTIKVLLQNERLVKFDDCTKSILSEVYEKRITLNSRSSSEKQWDKATLNVSYQQDIDTKHNFPSTREFAAFNKQRDMFYQILRNWQSSHFIPSWSFATELGPKIRSLLHVMDHPINMSHLAKLFTCQLLLSCTFDDAEPDLQLVLPKADPSKLSKLEQRFHAPSHFSTDYMFPGQQAFFKEFLAWTEHNNVFMEQLKTILISELVDLNDSTYEVLNVTMPNDLVGIEDHEQTKEYAVRSETIVKMRVLAKFVGLILSKPHQYEGVRCTDVDNRQIYLRNKISPEFNIKEILLKSILDRKLLIVVPWLVQYLSMLDFVTLRTSHYTDVLEILYEIYTSSGIPIQATSLFIVKSCLGWLFEQPNVPDGYFKYRQNRKPSIFIQELTNTTNNLQSVQILVPKAMLSHFVGSDLWVSNYEFDGVNQNLKCILRKTGMLSDERYYLKNQSQSPIKRHLSINPIEPLENILISACPFLADFRVSIMPQKHSKSVSRTGRFRHITTKTADLTVATAPSIPPQPKNSQTSLSEAFLHSQSLSVQRTVDFVIERTVSAVIKDFQVEHMLPLKSVTMDAVQLFEEVDVAAAAQKLFNCFAQAKERLMDKWQTNVPDMIKRRVEQSFGALLPNETPDAVKKVCIDMSIQKCTIKTNEWQAINFKGIDLFSKDLQADAEKLSKGSLTRPMFGSNIVIKSALFSPAQIFSQLQSEIYFISSQPKKLLRENVARVLNNVQGCISTHNLPDNMIRTAGFMTVQLALLIVFKRSEIVTCEILTPFISLWTCERLKPLTTPSTVLDAADPHERVIDLAPVARRNAQKKFYIFQDVLSIPGLQNLAIGGRNAFVAMEVLLVELLTARLLTIEHINSQCVRLLREEWPMDILNKLSTMLLNIVEHPKLKIEHSKDSLMFLEMLSDLSRDLEIL